LPLKPPPRDEQGVVVPHDHDEIRSDDDVIRRISEQQLVFDEKIGGRRISSMAFNPSEGTNGGLSVDLRRQIEEAGIDVRQYVSDQRWLGSVCFTAGALRENGFLVGYDPLPNNPHHGEIWGRFTRSSKKKLHQLCSWFVPIENVVIGAPD
jgi:hypothetical protein